ncbi:MAG: hypothetical protein ACLRXP_18200 [Oscillospiraceae bacterium]
MIKYLRRDALQTRPAALRRSTMLLTHGGADQVDPIELTWTPAVTLDRFSWQV